MAAVLQQYLHWDLHEDRPCVSGYVSPAASYIRHPLPTGTRQTVGTEQLGAERLGAIAADGSWAWIAQGVCIEVVDASSGARISAFSYSSTGEAVVRAVTEVQGQATVDPVLAVLIDCGVDRESIISIFDPMSSRPRGAIRVPHHVTTIESVDTTTSEGNNPRVAHPITDYVGCLALGTATGDVFLLDLRLDVDSPSWVPSSEATPSVAQQLSLEDAQVINRPGFNSLLAVGSPSKGGKFRYTFEVQDENGDLGSHMANTGSHPEVTALKYIKDTGTLVVGHAFGGVRLWPLANPSSPM